MKFFGKQVLVSLTCTFAFAVAWAPVTYAVDGCSSAGFKVGANINLEATLFGIAVGDFNGDGHLDLVAAPNNGSNEVMVLLGRGGTEKFGPPNSFPAGGPPRGIAVGDFNGDSKPDLAVTLDSFGEPPGRFSILINDGTGKFGAPNPINVPGFPSRLVLGDLNNDGKLDIATALSSDGALAILLGNGAGGFSHAANSPLATLSVYAFAVVIGDFNEDGKRDLAIPNNSGGVDILMGDGTGRFAPGPSTPANGGSTLTVGDFNEDGHLDLLSSNRMLLGSGTGNFSAPIVVELPAESSAARAGDVNQDGHLDVVVGGIGGLTIMLGNGTGNLVRAKSYTSGFAVLGDFNEDGKIDLAAVQRYGIGILDGDGTGAFNDALSYHTSISSPRYLVAADFNNDGKQDFATVGSVTVPGGSRIEVALGDGNGGFTKKSVSNFGSLGLRALATADFDNDGKLDLAVTQPFEGRISILLNDGTGGFPTNGFSTPNYAVGFQPSTIEAGDFNNDTKADLIVLTPNSNSFAVLLGNGSGGFTVMGGSPFQGNFSFADDVASGDFNADGKSDLAVVRTAANVVDVLQGDGTAHFSTYATLPLPGAPGSVVVRDLNGDDKPDIAVANSVFGQEYVSVLINNGAQGFNSASTYPTDAAGILDIGDFNADSKPDLAVSSGSGFVSSELDGIAILTNKGNGDFNAPVNFSAGQVSAHLAVRDFNNDGKDDVVISQPNGNSVGLLLNSFAVSLPCLSVNDVSITENDIGTTDAIFTVKLSAASAQTVRVNYFVTPTFWFLSPPPAGTVTFLPGETTQTIGIPIKNDVIDQVNLFYSVVLTTPVNAAISDGRGLGIIIDNDPPPTITINDVVVAEGTQVQSTATFTISLNTPSGKPTNVQYALQAGTASPDIDYASISGTVDFPAYTVSKTISVPIIRDNIFEPDETFFVNLSNAFDLTIVDGQGQGTISNDDPQPSVSISAASSRIEGASGTSGNSLFEVRLSNPSYQSINVSYATADGTATAGADYVATSGTLTFNPGETSKSIAVEVIGDDIDETNETYFLNVPLSGGIAFSQSVGTIQDDDGPTLSIGNASVTEGNNGTTFAVLTVTLSAPSPQDIFVRYSTIDGTAQASDQDFGRIFPNGGSLVFPAGVTSRTLSVQVFGDILIEPDQTFFVTLEQPSNATIANRLGTVTIINDDAQGKLQFSSQTYSVSEDAGSVVITVSRVDGVSGTVTVDYATSNGTAEAGPDYAATSGKLTIFHGETSKSFSIPIVNDNLLEADEGVNLTLSNPTCVGGFAGGQTCGVALGNPSSAVLTIKPPPLLLFLDESGPGPQQAAALDSLLFMRDPFPVIPTVNLFNQGMDLNTRVIVFVTNLQLAPGDVASNIRVNLVDSSGQGYDMGAEDLRAVPFFNFMQLTFRLPDNLAPGVCVIKIRGHDQESNPGTIRIIN